MSREYEKQTEGISGRYLKNLKQEQCGFNRKRTDFDDDYSNYIFTAFSDDI